MSQPAPARPSVTVNGEELPAWLFAREFSQLLNRLVAAGQSPATDAERQQLLDDALQNAIEILLLLQEADRTVGPLAKGPHRQRRDAWLREHGGMGKALQAFRLSPGQSADLEEIINREIRYGELVGAVARDEAAPSDADCRAFFEADPGRFSVPERAVFQQVFRDNQGDPANEFALLLRVRQQWIAGAPAELLGRQFGRPTPPEPGRFFDFTRGQAGSDWAEMEQALFALKPGEVSDVLRTGYGYHLLRLERVEPARAIPYDEAHASIVAHLHRERVEQTLGGKVDALRAAAVITGLPGENPPPA